MDHELPMQLRGATVQGVVLAVDDAGDEQTCTVRTHDGVERSGVPVAQAHGVYSNAGAGGLVLLLAVEGDQSNLVALPIGRPDARFGNLPEGGVALCDSAGNRLVFPADGGGELLVAALLRLWAGTLLVQTQGGTTIRGPVTFEDPVTFRAGATFLADVAIGGNLQVGGSITAAGTVNGR